METNMCKSDIKIIEIPSYDNRIINLENNLKIIKSNNNLDNINDSTYYAEFKRTTLSNAIEIYNNYIIRCEKILEGLYNIRKSGFESEKLDLFITEVLNLQQTIRHELNNIQEE